MGYEIRHVPADWKHPENEDGCYIPLLKWNEERIKIILEDLVERYNRNPQNYSEYKNLDDLLTEKKQRIISEMMPNWPEDQKTHIVIYENYTEGRPISPVFETKAQMAKWCSENRLFFPKKKFPQKQWKKAIMEDYISINTLLFG